MANYFNNGPGKANTAGISNAVSGSYYAPGTVIQNPNYSATSLDPNIRRYSPYSAGTSGTPSQQSPPTQHPQLGAYSLGPNAEQAAASGNTSPMGLGLASIQSSAPPYTPPINSTQAGTIQNQQFTNATNPSLPANQQYTYNPINPNASGNTLNSTSVPLPGAGSVGVQQGNTSQVANTLNPNNQNATYSASQAQAAQGTVDPNSLVQNQFLDINEHSAVDSNGTPLWALNAVTAARQQMAGLGLGSSTMMGGAVTSAILNTEFQMASQNAQVFASLNSQNLANLQQTLLSNTAAQNAAAQFNSQNLTQNNQFFQQLATNIGQFNASQANAMSQFNAGQTNTMAQFLAQNQTQREEFNAQNQLLVDQSNVQWQRAVNTANTAGTNAANQANVQNTFNMSQTALNNEWQMIQDQASWALSAGENSQNRGLTLASSALNQQTALSILNSQMQAQMFSQLGNLAANVLGGSGSIFKGIFGSNNSGSYSAANYQAAFESGQGGRSTYAAGNYGGGVNSGGYSIGNYG